MSVQQPLEFEFKPELTFDSFYPANNQEAIQHLQRSICEQGEKQILIWGNAGEGKSHLLQACCLLARQQQKTAFYLSLQNAEIQNPQILEGLEETQVVCLDDVQGIFQIPIWEQALFNFYNQHRANNHVLILATKCPPEKMAIQLPDLRTRLNWGLTLKLQELDDLAKIDLLMLRAQQLGLEMSTQVARFLLNHYARDLSSLWFMLDRIDHATLAAKRKISIPFVKQILHENP